MFPIASVLELLAAVVPSLTTSTAIVKSVDVLVQAIPIIIDTAPQLLQQAKNVINSFRSNPATPAEQLDMLDAQEAIIDPAWLAADAKAKAEDDAAAAQGRT